MASEKRPIKIKRIEKGTFVGNVTEQMERLIESGVWKEGDKIISENQLAKEFNVSRVVIREALQSLRSRNMIVTRQGLGSFVCNPSNFLGKISSDNLLEISEDDFISLNELRTCVENRAIQLSAIYGTDEDFAKIHEALNRMEAAGDDLDLFTEADLAFHLSVVESGHSSLLIKAYHSCQNELMFIFRELNSISDSKTYALSSHKQVFQAIKERNVKSALTVFKDMERFNTVRYSDLFKPQK